MLLAAWGQAAWEVAAPLLDTASAGVPSPQPKSVNVYSSCCSTVTHPKPGLAPTTLHLGGGLQPAAPVLPCPLTFPCPTRPLLRQCQPRTGKHSGGNHTEVLYYITHTLNTPSLLLENTAPTPKKRQGEGLFY